ncbi:MAG: glycoside hydrolase family 130 protein [Anaerolineae bacterium]|nr:glycoside hydrolase family 130 protein [Anaerolineae bacterium]
MPLQRFQENPLISPEDVVPSLEGWEVLGTYNCGAFTYDGKFGLLVRVIERPVLDDPDKVGAPILDFSAGERRLLVKIWPRDEVEVSDPRFVKADVVYDAVMNHLRLAWGEDGVHFDVEDAPVLEGDDELSNLGINDPRVLFLDGEYQIIYTANSLWGINMRLATTRDWRTFEKKGLIFPPDNKDVALFPKKIGDRYACLHRPAGIYFGGHDLWLAFSPDLLHWGDHKLVATRRAGSWDSERIGCGAEPLETEEGWLQIYHGSDGENYYLGAILLDLENPSRVIARSAEPLLAPEEEYEKHGYFDNVVFCNGLIRRSDDAVWLYYGGADRYTCGCEMSISDVLDTLR